MIDTRLRASAASRPAIRLPVAVLAIAVAVASTVSTARADGRQTCASAYVAGQQLRQDRKLTRAREELLACAQRTCPGFIQAECTRWLAEVEIALPTVVVDARDGSGNAVSVTKLWIDDELREAPGAGAIAVDPGDHTFVVATASGAKASSRVLIHEAEKSHTVVLTVTEGTVRDAPPSPTMHPATSSGLPALGYVFGAIGLVGLAGYGYFGISGLSMQLHLKSTCSPHCSEDDLSTLRRKYLAADISLAVLAVGAIGFTWAILTAPRGANASVALGPLGFSVRGEL